MRAALPALLAVFALAAAPALAQSGRGNQGRARQIDNVVSLSGQVVLPDGSPPPAEATIFRVCRGQQFPEGYTLPDGTFSFRLGRGTYVAMEDASTYGVDSRGRASGDTLTVGGITGDSERFSTMKNAGSVDLTGCEIRAVLDGYTAEAIPLARRNVFDNPDLGVIVLHPVVASGAGDSVSATTALAPKTAKKNFEKGQKELSAGGDPAKAAEHLRKAVEEHPTFAEAWEQLGLALIRMRDEPGALEAYRMAVQSDARYVKPYPALIRLLMRAQQWQELADATAGYLRMNPAGREERFYQAIALANLGKPMEAEAALEPLFATPGVDPDPQTRHFKASLLARRGDYQAAAVQIEAFLAAAPQDPRAEEARRMLAEWKALGVAR
jgi:Flp pilus assembly protein TadD